MSYLATIRTVVRVKDGPRKGVPDPRGRLRAEIVHVFLMQPADECILVSDFRPCPPLLQTGVHLQGAERVVPRFSVDLVQLGNREG